MEFTGERVIEGKTPQRIWVDHVTRYEFSAKYAKGKTVLDIACGTGYGSRVLHNKGKARKVIGIDISEDAIEIAWAHYKANGIEFEIGDAEHINFPADSFDLITSFETIEHVKNPEKMMLEFLRVLRPNGLLIISSPNRTLTSPGKSIKDQPDNPFHITEYSAKEFISVAETYFEILEIYGQRAEGKLLHLPFLGRIFGFCLDFLYDLGKGNPKLERVQPTREYRYIIIVCKKSRGNSMHACSKTYAKLELVT